MQILRNGKLPGTPADLLFFIKNQLVSVYLNKFKSVYKVHFNNTIILAEKEKELREVMLGAQRVTEDLKNNARKEAELLISEAELKANPRVNPLTDQEGDRFHQEMVSAQYSHAFSDRLTATAMAYRNSAAGAYDVSFGMAPGGGGLSIANYGLAHVWYGSTAALTWSARELSLAAGVTATDYHRDHWMAMRPARSSIVLSSSRSTPTQCSRETRLSPLVRLVIWAVAAEPGSCW